MSRDAASRDRRARLAKALRENLKRSKAQGRGRAAASAAPSSAEDGGKDQKVDAGTPASAGKTRGD